MNFFYDVLIFANGTIEDWQAHSYTIKLYNEDLGMEVSPIKSVFFRSGVANEVFTLI